MPTEIHISSSPPTKHHLFPLGVDGADPPYPLPPPPTTPPPDPTRLVGVVVSIPLLPVSLAAASFCRKLIHNSDILYNQSYPQHKAPVLGDGFGGDLFSVAGGGGDIM